MRNLTTDERNQDNFNEVRRIIFNFQIGQESPPLCIPLRGSAVCNLHSALQFFN